MKTILHINGKPITLDNVQRKGNDIMFALNGTEYRFRGERIGHGRFLLETETSPGIWQRMSGLRWAAAKGSSRVQLGALEAVVAQAHVTTSAVATETALSPPTPMPGLVRQIHVKVGEQVKKGQPLAVIEAMKLQMTLSAGGDAVVEAVLVKEGALVAEGVELVKLKASQE